MNTLFLSCFILLLTSFVSNYLVAKELKVKDISHLVSKQKFAHYKNVADFIDDSPKVTILVVPNVEDKTRYGQNMRKSLTGSDCDRDGIMDDNATCNAVYLKLWLKYSR